MPSSPGATKGSTSMMASSATSSRSRIFCQQSEISLHAVCFCGLCARALLQACQIAAAFQSIQHAFKARRALRATGVATHAYHALRLRRNEVPRHWQ